MEEELNQAEPQIHEAENGHTSAQEESTNIALPQKRSDHLTETGLDISQHDFTPSTSVSSHARQIGGFPILLGTKCPFKGPLGALRYKESPNRQKIQGAVGPWGRGAGFGFE
ncbi:hypothetical protein N7512_007529 [Penicillium capsulatum]|nr:hypothetical protein N7512_007529 [Penicillium capsulatum]